MGKPLTDIPDPFKKFNSYGEHNNEMLKQFLNKFDFKSAIFIQPSKEIDKNFALASSNIPKINCLTVDGLNIKDMLNHEKIFISKKAIQKIEEKLS